jgi:hypothetical protein
MYFLFSLRKAKLKGHFLDQKAMGGDWLVRFLFSSFFRLGRPEGPEDNRNERNDRKAGTNRKGIRTRVCHVNRIFRIYNDRIFKSYIIYNIIIDLQLMTSRHYPTTKRNADRISYNDLISKGLFHQNKMAEHYSTIDWFSEPIFA